MSKSINIRLSFILAGLLLIIVSVSIFIFGYYLDKNPIIVHENKLKTQDLFNYFVDFEDLKYVTNQSAITQNLALSGVKSGMAKGNNSYSPAVIIPIPTNNSQEMDDVNVKFWLSSSLETINAYLVFSILDQNNNQIYWSGYKINETNWAVGNWYFFQNKFTMPDKFVNSAYTIKIFIWNVQSNESLVYIDDVSVSLKENEAVEKPKSHLFNFEESDADKLSSKYAKSGFYSTYVKGKDDSTSVIIPISELNVENLQSVSLSFNYLSETKDLNAVFVLSVCDAEFNDMMWHGIDLAGAEFEEKTWETANGNVVISKDVINSGKYLKFYLWNKNENQVFIDDIYMIIKESDQLSDSSMTAFNMIKSPFQSKANQPPYNFCYVNNENVASAKISDMNNIFTKNSKVIVDKFDAKCKNDQLLVLKKDGSYLISFEASKLKSNKIKFSPALPQNSLVFADNSNVFVYDPTSKKISIYSFNSTKSEFALENTIATNVTKSVTNIVSPEKNTVSIIESNGLISDFYLENGKYVIVKSSKLLNPQYGNLKTYKSCFFDNEIEDLLCLFKINQQSKYIFIRYNGKGNGWGLSNSHSNKSLQSVDELDFESDYYMVDYDNNGITELLQFSKSKRFSLRLVKFDMLTYNILYNIDFRGFEEKQNPKYYEVHRILCGNFIDDSKSEILIYQDNVSNVDWLTQKTEMYSFGK